MAELENEVDVQDTDYELDVQDTQDDTLEEEITYEQALEWKKQAEKLKIAEQSAYEAKKALRLAKKAQASTQSIIPREEVKQILAEEKFYDKNPEAEAYRDKIDEFKSKGLSLEDAYFLASKKDRETDELREVYGKGIVQGNQSSGDVVKLISVSDYDKMSVKQQEEYNNTTISKFGGVRFK